MLRTIALALAVVLWLSGFAGQVEAQSSENDGTHWYEVWATLAASPDSPWHIATYDTEAEAQEHLQLLLQDDGGVKFLNPHIKKVRRYQTDDSDGSPPHDELSVAELRELGWLVGTARSSLETLERLVAELGRGAAALKGATVKTINNWGRVLGEYSKAVERAYADAVKLKQFLDAHVASLSQRQLDEINGLLADYNQYYEKLREFRAVEATTTTPNGQYTVWVYQLINGNWVKDESRTLVTNDEAAARQYVANVNGHDGWTATSNLPAAAASYSPVVHTGGYILYYYDPDFPEVATTYGDYDSLQEARSAIQELAEYGFRFAGIEEKATGREYGAF